MGTILLEITPTNKLINVIQKIYNEFTVWFLVNTTPEPGSLCLWLIWFCSVIKINHTVLIQNSEVDWSLSGMGRSMIQESEGD